MSCWRQLQYQCRNTPCIEGRRGIQKNIFQKKIYRVVGVSYRLPPLRSSPEVPTSGPKKKHQAQIPIPIRTSIWISIRASRRVCVRNSIPIQPKRKSSPIRPNSISISIPPIRSSRSPIAFQPTWNFHSDSAHFSFQLGCHPSGPSGFRFHFSPFGISHSDSVHFRIPFEFGPLVHSRQLGFRLVQMRRKKTWVPNPTDIRGKQIGKGWEGIHVMNIYQVRGLSLIHI